MECNGEKEEERKKRGWGSRRDEQKVKSDYIQPQQTAPLFVSMRKDVLPPHHINSVIY